MKEKTILFQYNIDNYGNPTSTKIKEVAQVSPLKYTIQLEQIPDEQYGVTLLNSDNTSMVQVFNYDDVEKTENSYYVNYTNGLIYFNNNQGAEKKIINYYGTGVELISCKRVFDGHYDANGKWIVEILQDIIDAGREAIEVMSSIGDVATILQMLQDKISEGDTKIQEIQDIIDEANDLTKVTGNETVTINTSDWVYNSTTELYEYTITHTMNSTNLIINCYNNDTNEFVFCAGKIIDTSSVLIQLEEDINLKVVLNARYYRATQTINDDIAQEVVQARAGENSLGNRLNKIINECGSNNESMKNKITELEEKNEAFEDNINDVIDDLSNTKEQLELLEKKIDEGGNIGDTPNILSEARSKDYLYKCPRHNSEKIKISDGSLMNAFPTMIKKGNTIIVIYREGLSHVIDGVIKQTVSTDDGKTWSTPTKILEESGYDLRDPNLYELKDGSLLLVVTRRTVATEARLVKVYKSTDFGNTWTYKCNIPYAENSSENVQVRGNAIIEDNGDILIPVYRQEIWGAYIVKSTDGGTSFSFYSWICNQSVKGYNETAIYKVDETTYVAVIRGQDGSDFLSGKGYYAISYDKGLTWGTPTASEYLIQAPTISSYGDKILLFYRNPNTSQTITKKVEFDCLPFIITENKAIKEIGTPIMLDYADSWDMGYSSVVIEDDEIYIASYSIDTIYFVKMDMNYLLNFESLTHIPKEEGETSRSVYNFDGTNFSLVKGDIVEYCGTIILNGDGTASKSYTLTLPQSVSKFLSIIATPAHSSIDGKYVVNIGRAVNNTVNLIIRHVEGSNWSTEKLIFFDIKAVL